MLAKTPMVDPKLPLPSAELVVRKFQEQYPNPATAQSSISKYKTTIERRAKLLMTPGEFKKLQEEWSSLLRLPEDVTKQLIKSRKDRVHAQSIDLYALVAEPIVMDLIKWLRNDDDPVKQFVALLLLTGRRTAEIAVKSTFHPARHPHFTKEIYWTCCQGICKQRGENPLTHVEIPILAPLPWIQAAVENVRKYKVVREVADANVAWSKSINRVIHRYLPEVGHAHQLRKFYMAFTKAYFNERNCSDSRWTAEALAHKSMSDSVFTYQNFKLTINKTMNFGRGKLVSAEALKLQEVRREQARQGIKRPRTSTVASSTGQKRARRKE
jgi:hypothetical protein